ncbi:hypothetical protein ALC56_15346 [Trachymyrmex septentrionalis]|uniref:Uncharacterized protein n=1 Tax=Trachymyrmex septentrionalis TaxID=34720 RepID=A0A151JT17_9HYME|nr:hypothetical protein ALC56_15346 [Trachymyrmex septentrionalis]
MSQLSDEDLTVIQLRLMPYDSQAALSQKKIEELVLYAKERRLKLFLGCDATPTI